MEAAEDRGSDAVKVASTSELCKSVSTGLIWVEERSAGSWGLPVVISHLCQKGSFSSLSLSAGLGEYKRSSRSLK